MFEVFKDECGEVRLKSNAVMKVWLGISIPVFFLCDFLFPWSSENQKKKNYPIYFRLVIQVWLRSNWSKSNAIPWDLKFELREGDIGNISDQFRHGKCVMVLTTNCKSWWFSRNDFSVVEKVARSWILKYSDSFLILHTRFPDWRIVMLVWNQALELTAVQTGAVLCLYA